MPLDITRWEKELLPGALEDSIILNTPDSPEVQLNKNVTPNHICISRGQQFAISSGIWEFQQMFSVPIKSLCILGVLVYQQGF